MFTAHNLSFFGGEATFIVTSAMLSTPIWLQMPVTHCVCCDWADKGTMEFVHSQGAVVNAET